MKKRLSSIFLVLALITTSAWAEKGHKDHKGHHHAVHFRALELTDDQKNTLADSFDFYSEDLRAQHEALATALTDLNNAILSGLEVDVRIASADVANAQVELNVLKAAVLQELIAVLTEDQYATLIEQIEKKNEHIAKRHDHILEFMAKLIDKHGSDDEEEAPEE